MEELNNKFWLRVVVIFVFGFIGILSALPIIPQLVLASGQELPLPMPALLAISTAQSSALLLAMVLLGAWLSPKVGLNPPVLDAFLDKSWKSFNFKRILVPSFFWGISGGVSLILFYQLSHPYLPAEFLENAENFAPPVYTKLLYGGITEEVLIRWGLMTFFVWGVFRLTQDKHSEVRNYNYVIGIVLAAVIFGVGHLPAAKMLSTVITKELIAYVIIGNSIFGLIAGYLYWKRGLESAMLAHMLAHVVMIVGEQFAR